MCRRKGSALFILLSLMFVCLSIAGLAINICYLELGRTELQIANDVCARAACSTLVRTNSMWQSRQAARQIASLNPVCGSELRIQPGDLHFGVATRYEKKERFSFSNANKFNPNSVWLQIDDLENHGIKLPLGIFGEVNSYRPWKESSAAQVELDLIIVLDCSSSMAWPADQTSKPEREKNSAVSIRSNARWMQAFNAIKDLLTSFEHSAQRESVALCTFSNKAKLETKLENDYLSIRRALNTHRRKFHGGMTNVAAGVLEGMKELAGKRGRPWASRAILLVSDGLSNAGPDPIEMAGVAADEFIAIHTLTFSAEGNETLMSLASEVSDGQIMHADSTDLGEAFHDVVKRLPIVTIR